MAPGRSSSSPMSMSGVFSSGKRRGTIMANSPVYILGGQQTDFARNWSKEGKHIAAMIREAATSGLEATDIDPKDVQVGHVGNFAAELYSMQGHLGAFLLEADPAFA